MKTQGIKYAGSKLKLLSHIGSALEGIEVDSVFDAFSGTTRVSQHFVSNGKRVIANDVSEWSYVFGYAYLMNNKPLKAYRELIDHLNNLKGREGWFTENYGGDGIGKHPFHVKNTMKLDAIRSEIDLLGLDELERNVALASLILALDKVDNTIGHYAAYLKVWPSRALKEMNLEIPNMIVNTRENEVYKSDILKFTSNEKYDLVYMDPPYGSNNEKMPPSRVRYSAYYHIWKTVVLNDEPKLFGVSKRREDSRDTIGASPFEEFRRSPETNRFIALEAIEKAIARVNCRYLMLSYSSGGRATKEELKEILERFGDIKRVVEIDYKKNVMSYMRWTNDWINSDGKNIEYLFLLEKS